MAFELDHIFIRSSIGAPEAERLIAFGLTEGSSNIHLGQGTTNRRFFFHNVMLELVWVHDAAEAQSDLTRPTYLWERLSQSHNCPFGLCLRPLSNPVDTLPFPAWEYRPAYLPESFSIIVADNIANLTEPMLFYLPFRKRQDSYPASDREPLQHQVGWQELTRLTLFSPYADRPSPELQMMVDSKAIELQQGENYLLELAFDREQQGKRVDFQPELPLVLCW